MNQIKTGILIKKLRLKQNLTQAALAKKLGISDKTISKWERGCGAPDLELLAEVAHILDTTVDNLLMGEVGENKASNGNLKKLKFYVCDKCHNLIVASEKAKICCCGKNIQPIEAKEPTAENDISVETIENEYYITAKHEMVKDHYISFIAFLNADTFVLRKLYPEWDIETRIPKFSHGIILWYCTNHGLFYKHI